MNLKHCSVAALGLLLAALGAWAAPAEDDTAPWRHVDTRGKNAVVVELSREGAPSSTLVILEGEKSSVTFPGDETALVLVAEWIAPRGDRARLGAYRADDPDAGEVPRSEDWLEDVELTRGGERVELRQTAQADEPAIGMRLLDTILPGS